MYPKPKFTMFCALFWKESWSKLSETPKNTIQIIVGQAILEFLTKTIYFTFWSTTQELRDLLNFHAISWVSQTICFRMLEYYFFFQKGVNYFEIAYTKQAQFWLNWVQLNIGQGILILRSLCTKHRFVIWFTHSFTLSFVCLLNKWPLASSFSPLQLLKQVHCNC